MKLVLTFLFLSIALVRGATPLMSNGGFEVFTGTQDDGTADTFGSWTTNHVAGGRMEATATAGAGTNAVKLITNPAGLEASIYQDVTVSASTQYSLNCVIRVQTSGADSVRRGIDDLSNVGVIVETETCGVTTATYGGAARQFTTPSGCTSIRVWFHSPGAFQGTGYVDAVSLTLVKLAREIYYIDYVGGDDSNLGTSIAEAWKRSPYMAGFAGSYVHFIGDTNVYKGGVTWPVACFPMAVTDSGVPATNDVHTVDLTYYSGGAWSRPVFDLEFTAVSGSGNTGSALWLTGSNITLYGLEIKGLRVDNSTNFNGYGVCSISGSSVANFITVQNCHIHNWRSYCPTNAVSFTDSDFGGIYFAGSGARVLQNTFGPGEAPLGLTGNSGGAVTGGAVLIQSNTFFGCSEMINAFATNISWNTFRNGTNSYDPEHHANAIFHGIGTGGRAYIYNNVFHDLASTFQTMLLHGGYGGATNTIYYIYNNLIWNVSSPVNLDESDIVVANSATYAFVFNNTIQNWITVGAAKRDQTYHLTQIDCRNNHWISDTPTGNPIGTAATSAAYAPVGTLIDAYNVWLTAAQAAAAGYTIGNRFAPTSFSSPTVGAGTDLTGINFFTNDLLGVERGSTWDSSAYEFSVEFVSAIVGTGLATGTGTGAGL